MACDLSLHQITDGGKWSVGVVTAMEAEKLAAQRQTHLGRRIVARYCCPGRETGSKSASHERPCTQESGH